MRRWLCAMAAWLALAVEANPAAAERRLVETEERVVKKGETYNNVQFPEGTRVSVISGTRHARYAVLSRDFRMGRYLVKGGTQLSTWDDGTLAEMWTVDGQKIGDLAFEAGEAALRFSRGGALESAHLHKAKTIQGVELAANSSVAFHPNGQLASGILARDQSLGGLNLKGGTEARWFPNGKLERVTLASRSKFKQFELVGDSNIANAGETSFFPSGRLSTGTLATPVTIQGFRVGPGHVAFFPSGRLREFVLGEARHIEFNPYPEQGPDTRMVNAGDRVTMNDSGTAIGWQGH